MASSAKSVARGGSIASVKSAALGGTIIVSARAARGATIVCLTALAPRRKDSRRRGIIFIHAGLADHRKDPRRHGMTSRRSRHGSAGANSPHMQPAAEQNDDYEDYDVEDGYKSPPGTPPRVPLTMNWQ